MTPVSVPLALPKIVPSDWDKWFKVWEENKKFVPKIKSTHNKGQPLWFGFDIYVKDGADVDHITSYHCKNVNCPELFPSLFDNIDKFPMDIDCIRVLQSHFRVDPHHDSLSPLRAHSIRTMLLDTNSKPIWYYILPNNEKIYLQLPEETNTWYYNDLTLKHGTDYTHGQFKQLIVYFGKIKEQKLAEMLEDSVSKYRNLSIIL